MCVATYVVAICVQFSTYGKSKEEMKHCLEQYFDKLESINASSIEFVKGISVVKMFGKSISSFQDFAKSVEEYHHFTLGFTYKCMRPFGLFGTLVNGFILFTLPFCAYFITRDTFNLYDILLCVFFILLSNGLIAPFLRLFNLSGELMQISEGVERIDKIFGSKPLPQSQNPQKPTRFDIAFESVDFAYADSSGKPYDKNALKNVSFALKEGESLAIVGKSGSGKSSVLRLLGRFYEPSSGAIKIGNANKKASLKNIAGLEIESLMAKFSMVFQNPYLFGGSVKSNVAFGKEDASDEEIEEALKSANALEFVNALPYGIDTKVSESGASLSGGERQRISIARCNLKNSPIILLDEITSSLDVYNEFAMQRALNRLAKDKTIIIITHKLKSVMNCDKIVFLKNGEIVESGTHKQLLALEGEYAKMWSAQNLG